MADKEEKVVPEAEQAAPVKEKKEKKKGKGGLIATIVIVAVLVLAIGGAALFAFLSGNQAVAAYKDKKYEEAYDKSQFAFFLNANDKDCINFCYINDVLYPNGDYYKAAGIADTIALEEAKTRLAEDCPLLQICKVGNVAVVGKYEKDATAENGQEDLEWIVASINDDGNGGKYATLITKDIVNSPEGWNRGSSANTKYSESNLNDWCQTFYSEMTMSDASLDAKILKVNVVTGDDKVAAKAYAPSKEELESLLTGDLAQYLKAESTVAAEGTAAGDAATGGSEEGEEGEEGEIEETKLVTAYYVRNASADGIGGYKDGAYVNNLAANDKTVGTRVCINVKLGAAK